ncbi:helix-turn-helix domain-containing protein [Planotetraspora sp. A-T 1434]|uniref:helix-turn-helix domain-containing protein n=1 Tax=Planotetraspora sp. A-T 1434 TaxID=2979219 RepID=UPI0021C20760|nr:helix-turn-helix domain-containing protein [Planotetraspora sp. A-T 1434]MCT9932516.1 helix-turn-helix domain-containing protein [Planotetraspora sp. A-T 1434]
MSDLLRTPAGRRLTLVAGPWDARPVEGVVLVDEMRELESAPPGALAILSRHAIQASSVLDALRIAGRGRAAAIVLPGPSGTSPDVVGLARQVGVALLAGASDHSLSDTVLGLSAALRADPSLLLRRTREAIEGLGAIEGAGEEDILRAASRSIGVEYGVAEVAEPAVNSAVIRVDGRPDGFVCWDGEDPAAAIVAGVVATTLGRVRAAARAAERARERALLVLLRAGAKDLAGAARRARHEGVPVDGWHIAVFLRDPAACDAGVRDPGLPHEAAAGGRSGAAVESGGQDGSVGPSEAISRQVRRMVAGLPGSGDLAGPPVVTRWQDGILVVVTTDERVGSWPFSGQWGALGAGVGTCQVGAEGLRRTASQARAAAGRAGAGEMVRFDRLGVNAILAELSGSDSALMAARDMLAPLDGLGALAVHAVPTLKAYLDSWGSRTRAAELLSLHPNAVAHRIRRIADALGADLSDPQTRFALQLACHVVLDRECLPGTTGAAASL